jgi:hypothetical protein
MLATVLLSLKVMMTVGRSFYLPWSRAVRSLKQRYFTTCFAFKSPGYLTTFNYVTARSETTGVAVRLCAYGGRRI